VPHFYFNSKYYFFSDNSMYSIKTNTWCAEKQNLKRISLPEKDYNEYRIINDSVAVFSFTNLYEQLYFCNYKTGALIKVDTIVNNKTYSTKRGSKEYKVRTYEFVGGSFATDKFYFLSARNNKTEKDLLLKFNLFSKKIDTVRSSFFLESYLHKVKSSNKYLVSYNGDFDVLNVLTNEYVEITNDVLSTEAKVKRPYRVLKSELDNNYELLDFINEEIVMLHHSKEPHKFALVNVINGKSELFELDKTIFRLENIREEEVFKVEDGPSDGLNKLKFKYLACRTDENQILLSFADKKDYRIVYSITFRPEILRNLN
jgi:hypothetical protein